MSNRTFLLGLLAIPVGLILIANLSAAVHPTAAPTSPVESWISHDMPLFTIQYAMMDAAVHQDVGRYNEKRAQLARECRGLVSWARTASPVSEKDHDAMVAVRSTCESAGEAVPLPY